MAPTRSRLLDVSRGNRSKLLESKSLPRNLIQQNNTNLTNANQKHVDRDVMNDINDLTTVMRTKNNIYIGKAYRLDALEVQSGGDGFNPGDFKVDIQTVEKQKKLSKTVAVVYVAPTATNASLADFVFAVKESIRAQAIYRVT